MKENMEYIGLAVEQNVNAEMMLILACVVLLPAVLIGLTRYAKFIITGSDFAFFTKERSA